MTFRHGVYTSEVETSLQTAPAVDSALPFVIGAVPNSFEATVVTSWRQFVQLSGIDPEVDAIPEDDGWFKYSLVSFAYLWFQICGRSECILRGLSSADGSLTKASVISAIGELDTVYERTRRTPSILHVPYFGGIDAIWTALSSKAELYGGRFKAIAVGDIQSTGHVLSGEDLEIVDDPMDVLAAKKVSSAHLALFWPYSGVGSMRFDKSSIACAVMNRVDAENGDLPFVSPSNKNSYETGVYVLPLVEKHSEYKDCTVGSGGEVLNADGDEISDGASDESAEIESAENPDAEFSVSSGVWHVSGVTDTPFSVEISYHSREEKAIFQSRDEVNTYLGANGIVGSLNTADAWVLWGNNTTAFPGSGDVKDCMLPIRRMFNYVQNQFQVFAQSRVDNPLNRRQLEGVVNSFNQILASLQGFGALNSASISLDDERNTTEQLIRGVVYFRIRIAPPPPMQEINGVFEFDVQGFEASLA